MDFSVRIDGIRL